MELKAVGNKVIVQLHSVKNEPFYGTTGSKNIELGDVVSQNVSDKYVDKVILFPVDKAESFSYSGKNYYYLNEEDIIAIAEDRCK